MQDLKDQLKTVLSSGKKITFEWDCGGDETLIDVFENKKPTNAKWVDPLCDVVAEKLELPNAGEYFVKGGGELVLKKEDLYVKHNSVASGTNYKFPDDFDFSEVDEDEIEQYSVEVDDEPLKGTVKLL